VHSWTLPRRDCESDSEASRNRKRAKKIWSGSHPALGWSARKSARLLIPDVHGGRVGSIGTRAPMMVWETSAREVELASHMLPNQPVWEARLYGTPSTPGGGRRAGRRTRGAPGNSATRAEAARPDCPRSRVQDPCSKSFRVRFSSRRIRTRLPIRTGATVRIAITTAARKCTGTATKQYRKSETCPVLSERDGRLRSGDGGITPRHRTLA
jgi:hypothetical protein